MATQRLPVQGQDVDNWGTILNDFLQVEHNPDGTLKASGALAKKADDSTVVKNSGAQAITGTKTFAASPVVPTPTLATQAVNKAYVDSVVSTNSLASTPPSYAPTGLLNSFDDKTSGYNFKASNTRRWRLGLAQAANGKASSEAWIGDSITGGCVNLSGYVFDRLNAIPRQYESAMASNGIPIAGTGIVPAYDGTHIDARWSWTGGWTGGISCATCSSAGSTATFTSNLPGTVVTVYIYDYTSGNVTVSVNGATSGSNFMTISFTSTSKWKAVSLNNVTGLVAGSTIAITTTTAGLVILSGIEVRKPTGLSVHNLALSGSAAGTTGRDCWSDTGSNYNPLNIWGTYQTQIYQKIPSVVHMSLLFFDSSTTPAAYTAAVTTIRNKFPNSDFIIHATPQPGSRTTAVWYPYLTALYNLADTLDVPLFDVQNLLGGYTAEAALGITGDPNVHLTTDAYSYWGRALARLADI
jgi:hypothetical protein